MMVDAAVGILLLSLAAGALYSPRLFGSITLFFAFGMVMALAWARLNAPDLALAEAAIGAGLSGALLFNAASRHFPEDSRPSPWGFRFSATLLSVLVFLLLLRGLWPTQDLDSPLPGLVRQQLTDSGVDYSVTAVLLNFRSWDTLLELAVLLLALMGLKVLRLDKSETPRPWPMLLAWAKTLAPVAVVVGGYLLWRGSHDPGGAFQAGALLAAGAVMLRLSHALPPLRWSYLWVRLSLLAGLSVFLLTALGTLWLGDGWLIYPEGGNRFLILLVESTATVSIAIALTLLVVGEVEELHS